VCRSGALLGEEYGGKSSGAQIVVEYGGSPSGGGDEFMMVYGLMWLQVGKYLGPLTRNSRRRWI
jgi:hypothetical protein